MFATVIFAGNSSPLFAESTIEARICDGVEGATLIITSPASDSLIDSSSITITGDVSQANQLEVFVDDAFNSVAPLDSVATSFTTVIQLPAGTHKITVTAIDACQVNNASESIVLTYQPSQLSSTGSEVPTGVTEEGGIIGSPQVTVGHIDNQSSTTVIQRYIAPVFDNIVDSLDLQSSRPDSATANGLTNMYRFIMTISGLVLIFRAGPITAFISAFLATGATDAAKWKMPVRRTTQAIGAILIALIFIL